MILERMKEKSELNMRSSREAQHRKAGARKSSLVELERRASSTRRQKVKGSALCRADPPRRCAKDIAVPCDVRMYLGPDIPST
jgi:hypothetical protein